MLRRGRFCEGRGGAGPGGGGGGRRHCKLLLLLIIPLLLSLPLLQPGRPLSWLGPPAAVELEPQHVAMNLVK